MIQFLSTLHFSTLAKITIFPRKGCYPRWIRITISLISSMILSSSEETWTNTIKTKTFNTKECLALAHAYSLPPPHTHKFLSSIHTTYVFFKEPYFGPNHIFRGMERMPLRYGDKIWGNLTLFDAPIWAWLQIFCLYTPFANTYVSGNKAVNQTR